MAHQHFLVPLWRTTDLGERYNIDARLAEIIDQLATGKRDQPAPEITDYDLWFLERLDHGTDAYGLDGHSVYAVSTFARLLGGCLLRLSDQDPSPRDHQRMLAAGFDVIRQGDNAISAALDGIAKRADTEGGEPKKTFGAMHARLGDDLVHDPAFAHFHHLYRECLLRNWPFAAGDMVAGIRLDRRRLHSLRSTWLELGIGQSIAEHFLTEAGVFAADDTRPHSRKLFDAERYLPLLSDVAALVGPQVMQRELGMTRTEFAALVTAGLLKPATAGRKLNEPWRLSEGRKFLEELQALVTRSLANEAGWEPISLSFKRTWAPLQDIIEAILQRKLTLATSCTSEGYHALRLNKDEFNAWFATRHDPQKDLPGVMSAAAFGRSVGIRDKTGVQALMADGHTPGIRCQNPRSKRMEWRVDAQQIAAFHEKFATVTTLRQGNTLSQYDVVKKLRRSGALPFTADGKSYGNLWLRADIGALDRDE